ncbi:hypothetical protein ABL78_7433 [Leptomonas seymouri]|uniref:Uncharacterized protein n=1 Tax=Leptomonas seymouri TaxID=5684 RepID=A0A0N1HZK7_LEPSE|nr:hypothetical protein ABL78_7433 [Leptomonas seymouri]|eukprot:KPI83534.1 hypothetical protein ABL78_7433 [Leptomonas seymouri]
MGSDFVACEIVLGVVFGAVFVSIFGMGVYSCLQRRSRMTKLQKQCEEVAAETEEKQQKLKWITGMPNLADDDSLLADDTSVNASCVFSDLRL